MSTTRAARRRAASATHGRRHHARFAVRSGAAVAATFVIAFAAIEIADIAPGDARLRAAAVVMLWAVTPSAVAAIATHPARTLRRWAVVALLTSAAWGAAAGLSAASIDGALSGPDAAVFFATFAFMFAPLTLIVLLTVMVARMRRLIARMREAATTAG